VRCAFQPTSLVLVLLCSLSIASAQTDVITQTSSSSTSQNTSDTLKLIDRLVEQNAQLEKQNKELIQQIQALRQGLTQQTEQGSEVSKQPAVGTNKTITENVAGDVQEGNVSATSSSAEEEPYKWGGTHPTLATRSRIQNVAI